MVQRYKVKTTKNAREAKKLQEQGWELTGIDRKLTVPNVFHLRYPLEDTRVIDTVKRETLELIDNIQAEISEIKAMEKIGKLKKLRLKALELQLKMNQSQLDK